MHRHEHRLDFYLETAVLAVVYAAFVWMLLKDWARFVLR